MFGKLGNYNQPFKSSLQNDPRTKIGLKASLASPGRDCAGVYRNVKTVVTQASSLSIHLKPAWKIDNVHRPRVRFLWYRLSEGIDTYQRFSILLKRLISCLNYAAFWCLVEKLLSCLMIFNLVRQLAWYADVFLRENDKATAQVFYRYEAPGALG